MNQNSNQDYKSFGGWLLVFYLCTIIGGILALLGMALPALLGIVASFLRPIYGVGVLVGVGASIVSTILLIKSAIELKAKKLQFFDTLVLALVINVCGSILSNFLTIRSAAGVGSVISSSIFSLIGFAIGICLYIMFFSKSVRVAVYFAGRPLQYSKYWDWIKLLPSFIISENMPDPTKMQQIGSTPQQSYYDPQNTQPPPPVQTPPVQTPPVQAPPVQAPPAQVEENVVFCSDCGAKNEGGKKFCSSCGKSMT